MSPLRPLNLRKWIDEHRDLLKPPVGNQQVWQDRDFIVMVIGGPNSRQDYHINSGEEFFYQVEGDIVLKVLENGKPVDIPIREGEIFLLPPNVPHSPRRPANTVGLVIEKKRQAHEKDGFAWFCEGCGNKLHDEYLHVTDMVKQLPPIFDRFYMDASKLECRSCGKTAPRPDRYAGKDSKA